MNQSLKLLLFIVLGIAMNVPAISQTDSDYTPLLKEGMVWRYKLLPEEKPENPSAPYPDVSEDWYDDVFIKGDTVVDGVPYKKVYRTYYRERYDPETDSYPIVAVRTELLSLLREKNKKIYGLQSLWRLYGIEQPNGERLLLDFEDMYEYMADRYEYYIGNRPNDIGLTDLGVATVRGLRQPARIFNCSNGYIIDGIGFVNTSLRIQTIFFSCSFPYFYEQICYCGYFLYSVQDADGEYIFHINEPWTEVEVKGIGEDRQASDPYYYDLMGRKTLNPTSGFYIHKGKKILIK